MGFGEIQFDYIRFPEPYKSLPQQVFPDNKGQPKPEAIHSPKSSTSARLSKLRCTTSSHSSPKGAAVMAISRTLRA